MKKDEDPHGQKVLMELQGSLQQGRDSLLICCNLKAHVDQAGSVPVKASKHFP